MQNKIVVLGAGIAGIGAGYKLENRAVIYEARDRYGGLCDNFIIGGFRFDYAVHLSFSNADVIKSLFYSLPHIIHEPIAYNYADGYWVKHPIQNNSFSLPVEDRIQIIKSFIDRNKSSNIINYEQWLNYQYGVYFQKQYPGRYTKKYWCCETKELSVGWINNRMYQPSLDEVLHGAMTEKTENTYYANEMRYPANNGFRGFFESIADDMDIKLSHRVVEIDVEKKKLKFQNGLEICYSNSLISSLPLPEITSIIKSCPDNVVKAAQKLVVTSICLVSVGFKNKIEIPSLWFYVYDENIPFARAYSPSLKSNDNVPPDKSSLQFEIYYTKHNPLNMSNRQITQKIIEAMKEMGLAGKEDIEVMDIRHVPYGNVVFYNGMENDRKIVLDYLKSKNIKSIGRFGEWDYLWSDQSFLSGYMGNDE